MSIPVTVVDSIHGAANQSRMIFYRCQDHTGAWHSYGPVMTNDPNFDANAHKAVVAVKVANMLAEAEAAKLLEGV